MNQENDGETSRVKAGDTSRFKDVQQFNGFDVGKKSAFLEMFKQTPNMSGVARAMGFNPSTIYLAMGRDPAFKAAVEEAREELCDGLEARVHEYGQRPQNFMDRIAWLRAYRPRRWNPDRQMHVTIDQKQTETLAGKAESYVEAEVVSTERTPVTDEESGPKGLEGGTATPLR